MVTSTIDEAQSQLAHLIDLAESGEEIVIARARAACQRGLCLTVRPMLRVKADNGKGRCMFPRISKICRQISAKPLGCLLNEAAA